MRALDWEMDGNGSSAITIKNSPKFISLSAAASISRGLMHEATTISAEFSEFGLLVFSRLAGVSIHGKETAVYYGLYGSSNVSEGPNYCLRRTVWGNTFGTVEKTLQGMSSKALFFNLNDLSQNNQMVINSVDCRIDERCEITSSPSDNVEFADKKVCYFISDNDRELACKYSAGSSTNPYVEKVFADLEVAFNSLNEKNTTLPVVGTFRVSYSFQRFAGL